jgi:23S rRNA (guanosine2251-2'-O)-methyltransferase
MAKPSFAPPSADRPAEGENFAAAAPSDLIWGRHAAQAALESGRPVHRVWCTPEMRFSPRFLQLLREAKGSGALVEEVTWARLGQISGGAVHQGIVLQPAAAETLDLDGLLEGCRGIGEAPLLLAVDGLTDPQNLGAIVRSAEALGAHGLVLPQRRNAGLTGTVAKVAAGALEHLPIARVVNLNRSLDTLKQEGYRVIGLAAEGTVSLEEADLEGPLVLVTGSEGEGLSLLTRRHCDQLVRIPLRGTTPSLNASVATALLLYEVARRSWMRGLSGSAPAPRLVRPALPSPPLRPLAAPQEGVDPSDLAAGALLDGGPKPAGSAAEPKPERHPQVQPTALEGLDPASEPQPSAASPQPDGEPVLEPSAEAGEIQSLEQAPAELLAEPLALQPAEPPFHESQPAEPLASVPVLESSLGSAPLPSPDSSPGSLPPAQLQAAAPVDQVPGSAPGSASESVPGSDAGTGPGAEPPAPVLAPPPADPWSEGVQGYEGASFSGDVRL